MVALKTFMTNLLQHWFSDRSFYVTITDADIGSLKSLRTLFDKYLDHTLVKFEQNCMVRNIQHLERLDQQSENVVLINNSKTAWPT